MSLEPVDRLFWRAVLQAGAEGEHRGRLCGACLAVLPVDGAAVVLVSGDGHREVVCASDDPVQRLEEAQVTLGEGPSVEAFTTGGPVLVTDLSAQGERWPMFAAAAAATPMRGMFAFPLQRGAIRVGALDLYRDEPGPLDHADLAAALRVAEMITNALVTSVDGEDPLAVGQLFELSTLNREINQATGMVLAQLGVSAEEALVRIRAFAFAHNRRIGDVARDVLARQLRFDPDERR